MSYKELCGLIIFGINYRVDIQRRMSFTILAHAKLSKSMEVLSNDYRIKLGKTIASSFKSEMDF